MYVVDEELYSSNLIKFSMFYVLCIIHLVSWIIARSVGTRSAKDSSSDATFVHAVSIASAIQYRTMEMTY